MVPVFHPEYFVDRRLGTGSFGEVYLVHNQRAENFALKVLRADIQDETPSLAAEVALLARLQHNHLVTVYDYLPQASLVSGVEAKGPAYLMEYLPGKSLAALKGKLSFNELRRYFLQALGALDYLHRRRLLHGDLKPENLRLSAKGELKLLDFGLASSWQPKQVLQSRDHKSLRGTPAYLAPEAFSAQPTERSDLFSLAAVFYELITGDLPFALTLPLQERFTLRPKSLSSKKFGLPHYFTEILERMLQVDNEKRFSSAAVILRTLATYDESLERARTKSLQDKDISAMEFTLPFVGREAFLDPAVTQLKFWSSAKGLAPIFCVQGKIGIGKRRFAEELLWQAQLMGVVPHTLEENTALHWLRPLGNENYHLVYLKDFSTWSEPNQRAALKNISQEQSGQVAWLLNSDETTELMPAQVSELHEIKLSPWSLAETKALLAEIPHTQTQSDKATQTLWQLSEGNPSLLLAMTKYLSDQLKASQEISLETFSDFVLPKNLRQALMLPWQSLSAMQQKILASLAMATTGLPLATLLESLSIDLTDWEALTKSLPGPLSLQQEQGMVRLGKPLLAKTLLGFLSETNLQQIGKLYLTKLKNDTCFAKTCSWQQKTSWARHAKDLTSFRSFALQAAKASLELGQVFKSLHLFQEILNAKPTRAEKTTCYAHIAAANLRLGDYREALEAYEKWYALTEDDGTKIQTIKFHYLCGITLFSWGKLKEATGRLHHAVTTGDSAKHPHHRPFHLKAFIQLAKVAEAQQDSESAKKHYESALAIAVKDSPEKTQLLRQLGLLALKKGKQKDAKEKFEAALKMSEGLNYEEGIANNAYVLADLLHQCGDVAGALKLYAQVLSLAQKNQDPLKEARTLVNLAAVFLEQGDYARVLEHAKRSQVIFENAQVGNAWDQLLVIFQKRAAQTYLGQFQHLPDNTLWQMAIAQDSLLMQGHLKRLMAESLRLQRKFSQALSAYQEAKDIFVLAKDDQEFWLTCLQEIFTECLAGDLNAALEKYQALPEFPLVAPSHWKDLATALNQCLPAQAKPNLTQVQALLEIIVQNPQQELCLLSLQAFAEILTRRHLAEGAELLRRQAWDGLATCARGLPEELAFSFQQREDFTRLADQYQKSLQSSGLSRKRFLSFAKINQRLSQERDMNSILQQVMDAAMDLAGAERGFLLLRETNESNQDSVLPGYRIEAAHNLKKEKLNSEEFKISRSVIEQALSRRSILLTDNAQADPDFEDAASVHLYQLKSILVVPLVGAQMGATDCLGALYLDHRFEVGIFSEERLVFLKAFADQAVLAIEKAKALNTLEATKQSLEHQVEDQAQKIEHMEVKLKEARQGLRYGYEEIIGQSPKMIQVLSLLDRVTDTLMPVWIHGESGTGKELIARALHFNSDRKDMPFITENCSAIPDNLLESILFGHVKGAFTHAEHNKKGLFAAAHGGTIFLDEIGDMPLSMQAKLLRVLQEKEIRPVGATESIAIDVRIVTATNKDLPALVKRGKFREDLFFRINGLKIELPPLRERKEDIPPLTHHFIRKISQESQLKECHIEESALSLLTQYDWPGNIRELENTLRNGILFAEEGLITQETLSFKPELMCVVKDNLEMRAANFSKGKPSDEATLTSSPSSKKLIPRTSDETNAQREAILAALSKVGYHKGEAARELGITPRHLYNLLEKHGLPKNKWALKKLVQNL